MFLTLALAIGSVGTLAGMASLRDRGAVGFLGSPFSAVRAYYAAVNHYITTGDIEAIHEIGGFRWERSERSLASRVRDRATATRLAANLSANAHHHLRSAP